MLNYIWGGMILLSLIVSLFTGRIEETAAAAVTGASSAVEISLTLLGIMCLWGGLAKIGERAGLIDLLARLLHPLLRLLFPDLDKQSPARGKIILNITANLLGMGNAATPLGIDAIRELNRLSPKPGSATNAMCMLVVLNTASIQLLPTTLLSLRQTFGSSAPAEIIVPIWLTSICALIAGITAAKLLERRYPL